MVGNMDRLTRLPLCVLLVALGLPAPTLHPQAEPYRPVYHPE